MNLQNINFFTIFSLFVAALSLYAGIYSVTIRPFRNHSISFAIFSIVTFIASLSTALSLSIVNIFYANWLHYLFMFSSIVAPVSLLILIIDFLGYKHQKIRNEYKNILYLIPLSIMSSILLFGTIEVVPSDIGNQFSVSLMKFFGPYYLTPMSIIVIFILSREIYKRKKLNSSISSIIILLTGNVIYTIGQFVYQILLSRSIIPKIPSYTISVAPLFIFLLISLFTIKTSIHNITLASAFEKVQDCILITDNKGSVLEFNNCFMRENVCVLNKNEDKKVFRGKDAIDLIPTIISDKSKSKQFFKFLKSSSKENYTGSLAIKGNDKIQTYSIITSPIFDKRNYILGRISIFRDITRQKKYEKEIEYLSFHDKLTGLYNRLFFDEELKRIDDKRHLPISIIMADIDGLKHVNDKYGHTKGDQLIIAAAGILKDACRKSDIVSRWGGDEYVVLLPKTSKEMAEKTIDRIKHAYNGKNLDNSIRISISLGYATKSKINQNTSNIMMMADKDMYKNKNEKKKNISA